MANGAKPRARTQRINHATPPNATRKETMDPIASAIQLCEFMLSGAMAASPKSLYSGRTIALRRSYPVDTAIVGIERKKENSSAAERDRPTTCAAAMVHIEREVPGKTAERICAAPIVA